MHNLGSSCNINGNLAMKHMQLHSENLKIVGSLAFPEMLGRGLVSCKNDWFKYRENGGFRPWRWAVSFYRIRGRLWMRLYVSSAILCACLNKVTGRDRLSISALKVCSHGMQKFTMQTCLVTAVWATKMVGIICEVAWITSYRN